MNQHEIESVELHHDRINSFLRRLRYLAIVRSEAPKGFGFDMQVSSWNPMEWGCALGGECGEVLNETKKFIRDEAPYRVQNIGSELADVVIYASLLSASLGLDLQTCIEEKFNETSKKVGFPIELRSPGT